MTLVLTVTGPESIWLLADRRLSYEGRPPRDDARKVMCLSTTDGRALLGYAGLGATALGTEPADWMSMVLRGRNLPLEQSLGVLAEAMQRQIPRHLIQLPENQREHHVVAVAFLNGEPKLYSIDLALSPDGRRYRFRYTRHIRPLTGATPRLAVGGSGGPRLGQDTRSLRNLLRLVRANERGNASSHAVADYLARLNSDVAADVSSVGPRCIVVRRLPNGGGEQWYYTGLQRDDSSPPLATISRGEDMRAFVGALMPQFMEMADAVSAGEPVPDFDGDQANAALARLPRTPDENLR